ncbi:hypothetical protein SD37_09940 [Amycolatopsis orientalis]|uniref:Uncharacterized protein n=1 Tax=Amycolatopsis orientalis TaxID=31958 RepID=A0A193BUN3_AMYOR|nr:hypothetical protein [Amycolatopsis orientalis]ANN15931.1 hypothetical protein SD37_09940 [Amycolatopsis orientalis]
MNHSDSLAPNKAMKYPEISSELARDRSRITCGTSAVAVAVTAIQPSCPVGNPATCTAAGSPSIAAMSDIAFPGDRVPNRTVRYTRIKTGPIAAICAYWKACACPNLSP